MDIQGIHSILLEKFGAAVVGSATHPAIDPWIQVEASAIVEVAAFLRDDERLQFNHLNDLCGVDYLETDPKKARKVRTRTARGSCLSAQQPEAAASTEAEGRCSSLEE